MNRDFFRPLLILSLAAILVGLIAMIIPQWENDVFPIRKMHWFSKLFESRSQGDSLNVAIETIEHIPSALDPFLMRLGSLPVLSGQTGLVENQLGARSRKLRIAYFSDSTIEGDLITAPLRYEFQKVYGGTGVGMMPITSIVSGFRQTIRHNFSKNWESISFMSPVNKNLSLGITGYTFIPRPYYSVTTKVEKADTLAIADSLLTELVADSTEVKPSTQRHYVDHNAWVEYKAVDISGGAGSFANIRLFYSNASDSSKVYVSYESSASQSYHLSSRQGVQVLDISPGSPVKSVRLEFLRDDPIHVYGVSFDAPKGVYVDNFPIRGYSGMYFSRIHENVLRDFQSYLEYDLIVLQYGENVSNPANRDYSNYKNAMIRTVEHIHKSMPKVPVLIVSAHDRSIKEGGSYKTSPDIPILVKTQAELARETDSAFFNLFDAMGGYNSMQGLVQQKPALASSDYTHFNRRGADWVAKLLLNFLTGDA